MDQDQDLGGVAPAMFGLAKSDPIFVWRRVRSVILSTIESTGNTRNVMLLVTSRFL